MPAAATSIEGLLPTEISAFLPANTSIVYTTQFRSHSRAIMLTRTAVSQGLSCQANGGLICRTVTNLVVNKNKGPNASKHARRKNVLREQND